MNKQIALVIGATGLVGKELVEQLIQHTDIEIIKIFVRRKSSFTSRKIEENIVDFDAIEDWKHLLQGDALYSAFGTTLKKAGSKENQYKIDFTYQFEAAKYTQENGAKQLVLVSSAGANSKSNVFYSKMKGELDDAVKTLGFKRVSIIRPSILDGDRSEKRSMEKMAISIMRVVCVLLPFLKKYRPIHVQTVAKAMINAAETSTNPYTIFELEKVFWLANSAGR